MNSDTSELSPPSLDSNSTVVEPVATRKRGSVLGHVALLSLLLTPIAFIPYIITRRQLLRLRRQVDELGAETTLLQAHHKNAAIPRSELARLHHQLELSKSDRSKLLSTINDELGDMRGELHSLREQFSAVEVNRVNEALRQVEGQQESLQSQLFKLSDEMRTLQSGPQAVKNAELHRLLEEARVARGHFASIGSSLGDVAALLQRVEIELGHERTAYDPVERLRILALRMQEEQK